MSLEARIDLLVTKIATLAERLAEFGFEFDEPDEAFPGREDGTDNAIALIEREAGVVPLALRLFWQRVGSINFCGSHPKWELDARHPGFEGDAYPDPLFVFPPSAALAELEEFLADKEQRIKADFPYVIPIAPDSFHKADVSGGMWYNVSVPAVAADPPLNDEWHKTTFLGYLEVAMKWGGFPGLERCPHHNWPVVRLTEGR